MFRFIFFLIWLIYNLTPKIFFFLILKNRYSQDYTGNFGDMDVKDREDRVQSEVVSQNSPG